MSLTADTTAPFATDCLLRDGTVMRLRTPTSDDLPAAREFFAELSPESLYFRFFSPHRPSDEELARYALGDHDRTTALAAEIDGKLVGLASAVVASNGKSAEVAFAVADLYHHRGIATLMLEHLAAMARAAGIFTFTAITLVGNRAMLDVFRRSGFDVKESLDVDVWDVEIALELDTKAEVSIAEREQTAEASSIAGVLSPATVAVVGASNTVGSVGHALFQNLLTGGYQGVLYPIHPAARSVQGVRAYTSVDETPDRIDLAVIAVPAQAVASVLDACGAAGAKAAVVITAGFAEAGVDGAEVEAELLAIARRHGMRLIGPNCIGIINSAPDIRLDATFSPIEPVAGPVGFASQSGAMGIAALAEAHARGIGISSFVSLGNKADVSGNDLLQYWQTDPSTEVAVLYLESFGNPEKFSRIARRFSQTKPLVVMKSGRTEAGRRAASSHTAAMSSDDELTETLFSETGIIRAQTMGELFDTTRLFVHQPLPTGRRVAIVGNSGGPGILAADACTAAGLEVPELAAATQKALDELLPPGAGLSNPVDLIAAARGDTYETALRLVLADDAVDAVLIIYTDPMVSEAADICAGVARALADGPPKPVVASFLAADVGAVVPVTASDGTDRSVPVYDFPEDAAIALGHAAWLSEWRSRPPSHPPEFDDVDPAAAAKVIGRALADRDDGTGTWLEPDEIEAVLASYGIALIRSIEVSDAAGAASAANELGGSVAMKALGPEILHKSDVGGVVLDIGAPEEAAAVYDRFLETFGETLSGAIVQPMAAPGPEIILGVLQEATFGPVVLFGTGGTTAELWGDTAHALVPVSSDRAATLVREPRGSALLFGYRGSEPSDVDALEDLVLRLSTLAAEHPTIAELDLNPVIVGASGYAIVDARCRVALSKPRELEVRRLRKIGKET